jgi:Protein of unknown function (DUF2380)
MGTLENARRRRPGAALGSMRRLVGAGVLTVVAVAAAASWTPASRAAEPLQRLVVLPFEIEDRSGEAGASTRYDAMLAALSRSVTVKIAAARLYDVVPQSRIAEAVAAANPGTYLRGCNGCERDIARSVGADQVLVGWIFKMSSLVLSLHVVLKDVTTGRVLYARVFDFRGDNERAWMRAADNMVRSLDREI